MALSRTQIVEAAYAVLREHGLAGLTMRRLAQDLGVQAGAIYYHVASKQDLLAAVAVRILADTERTISTTDPAQAARDIRDTLLPVRDSADVISFVQAFKPDALIPFRQLHELFAEQFPAQQARWAAQTLIRYVLGFVAEEHNRAELVRANILSDPPSQAESLGAFLFGVEAVLQGLAAMSSQPSTLRTESAGSPAKLPGVPARQP